ncbi:hypothetical protein DBR42_13685 [Pelomonas sp. HMWF004]|nr:hypothetical protein DBR42_13685 [Pelomonas sp. HMWF004]
MSTDEQRSFGVFKPVGHVVVSFPGAEAARQGAQALDGLGLAPGAVRHYSDTEMLAQIDADLSNASPLASLGQEMNLVLAHQALAECGYHWLVVKVRNDEQGVQVAEAASAHGAERAQLYGHFIIEELIKRPGHITQVAESPDRGLDAQTPSGKETEACELKRAAGVSACASPGA